MNQSRIPQDELEVRDWRHQQLCFLVTDGYHRKRTLEYRKLVDRAEFRCLRCGRSARHEENLCSPSRL